MSFLVAHFYSCPAGGADPGTNMGMIFSVPSPAKHADETAGGLDRKGGDHFNESFFSKNIRPTGRGWCWPSKRRAHSQLVKLASPIPVLPKSQFFGRKRSRRAKRPKNAPLPKQKRKAPQATFFATRTNLARPNLSGPSTEEGLRGSLEERKQASRRLFKR